MIWGAFAVLGLTAIFLLYGVHWFLTEMLEQRAKSEDVLPVFREAAGQFDRFVSAIIPLFGAWVSAVIAFYFARDNYDAATENTRVLLSEMRAVDLKTISVEETMVPRERMIVAVTGEDDPRSVLAEILPRFGERGRIVVLDAQDRGVGVLHKSYVTEFLARAAEQGGGKPSAVTFAAMLADGETRNQLDRYTIYVRPDANLATVREAMQAASRALPLTVADAFVTADGGRTSKVLGYLTDLDIAKRAKLGG